MLLEHIKAHREPRNFAYSGNFPVEGNEEETGVRKKVVFCVSIN